MVSCRSRPIPFTAKLTYVIYDKASLRTTEGRTDFACSSNATRRATSDGETRVATASQSSDGKMSDALFLACFAQEWGTALKLIARKKGLTYLDPKTGRSVLYVAAEKNAPASVAQKLMAEGLSPNARDQVAGFTPVFIAAQKNVNIPLMQALLDGGGDPNLAETIDLQTPVLTAAFSNANPALVEALYAAGGDNRPDRNGTTPIYIAAEKNVSVELLDVIIRNKGDPNLPRRDGVTPVYIGAQQNATPALIRRLLEAGGDPNRVCEKGATPVFIAAQQNSNPHMMRELLMAGGDPNRKNLTGGTPVDVAAQMNVNPALLQVLLDFGGDPNLRRDDGATAVYTAAAYNASPLLMRLLLRYGGDPCVAKNDGCTPTYICAGNKVRPALLKLLLDAGADPNRPRKDGWSPLTVGVAGGASVELMTLLLEYGADPAHACPLGTALDIAKVLGHNHLVPLLSDPPPKTRFVTDETIYAALSGAPDVVASPKTCAFCGTDSPVELSKCSQCETVWYCDQTCQRAHWKEHKGWCKPREVVEAERAAAAIRAERHRHPPVAEVETKLTPASSSADRVPSSHTVQSETVGSRVSGYDLPSVVIEDLD